MENRQLKEIEKWFNGYVQSFSRDNKPLHHLLQLKADHSKRVQKEAKNLATNLGWDIFSQNSASALGLLHDFGRFSQFEKYGTFLDSASINHGEHGWTVAKEIKLLYSLSKIDYESILNGIRYHNAKTIPENISSQSLSFLKVICDADKLDIFGIVLKAVEKDGFQDLPKMLSNIILDRSFSFQIIEEFQKQQVCSIKNVKTLGDFLIMQLSWIYDLNYSYFFKCFAERQISSRIFQQLNDSPMLITLNMMVAKFVNQRLSGNYC